MESKKKIAQILGIASLMVVSAFSIFVPRGKAPGGTVTILADGSIDPPTAPVSRVGDVFTLTDNIYDSIFIDRSNIVVDGAGHSVVGSGSGWGFSFGIGVGGITIKNTNIEGFIYGISLLGTTSNNVIIGNSIINCDTGIRLWYGADDNLVTENVIADNWIGVDNEESVNNAIVANIITGNSGAGFVSSCFAPYGHSGVRPTGIQVSSNIISNNGGGGVVLITTYNSEVTLNTILNNGVVGITLWSTLNVRVVDNIVANNGEGIRFIRDEYRLTRDNVIYCNNFVDNTIQFTFVDLWPDPASIHNSWDNGYPEGGNYWSDYATRYPSVGDVYAGINQDLLGSDGIWDDPYDIFAENQDIYPHVEPCAHALQAWSSDILGNPKDTFVQSETVYMTMTRTGQLVRLYVVIDQATWNDGDPLTDVSDGAETLTLNPPPGTQTIEIWTPPLAVGSYDIVMDVDNDGVFDAGLDVVDSIFVPGFNVIPEVPLGTAMAFLGMLIALIGFAGFKRFKTKFRPQ